VPVLVVEANVESLGVYQRCDMQAANRCMT
jgi:hypothetical protein